MTFAWISLLALAVVIVLSCTNRVHPGFLALALAWVIGVFVSPLYEVHLDLKKDVLAGFPVDLFLTLTGVSLLFTQAHRNGTLDKIAHAAVGLCRGNVGLIPWMFFLLCAGFATAGAGNIAAAALLAPTAMAIAAKARIPAVLMTIVVGHGAIAGALSPIAPTGLIAETQMDKIGLSGHGMTIFLHNLIANFAVAILAFILFGGVALFRRRYDPSASAQGEPPQNDRLAPRQWATVALIIGLMGAVIFWNVHVGMGAFACAVILALTGLADDTAAVKDMPWSVILMVCGVNVLTALLENEKIGGTRLFAELVVTISSADTAPAILGFTAAIVSVYSSTSGVVLPAFLPMVKDVALRLPGSSPLALALSVIVAGHLVDSSPLSTIGALCIAGAGAEEDRRGLFLRVLAWGLAMAGVGAVWCYVVYGVMWI
ncbi:MAG: C4-dicarboxylate ABC transporter [Gemmataceae bacterium]|nr:C4-dicarboxylate ABC transporter [Gemmataceae bacterium]